MGRNGTDRGGSNGSKSLLVESAYNRIRKLILDGQVIAGEALGERRLADELGISRTPIRLALNRLEQERLVVTVPQRGTFVESLTPTDLASIFDVREVVEGLAARLLARQIAPAQADQLPQLAAKADDGATLGDEEAFHMAIIDMCGDRRVQDIVATSCLGVFTYDERTRRLANAKNVAMPVAGHFGASSNPVDHRAIADAIISGDEEEAEIRARRHIRHGKAVVIKFLLGVTDVA